MKRLILLFIASIVSLSSFAQVSGSTTVCVGGTSTLSDATAGGTWTSYTPSIATIGSTTGIVYGVSAGTAGICSQTSCCASNSVAVTVSTVGSIVGSGTVCVGANITLSDYPFSGTWSSSNTGVATVFGSGVSTSVYGVAAGTANISYTTTSGGCSAGKTVTVSNCGTLPAITGSSTVCLGSTTNLSDATTGGTWASDNTSVATVSASGVVYGFNAGTANIFYYASGYSIGHTVTVSICPPPAITGRDTVCIGTPTQLSDATAGGTWSTSSTARATISTSGMVTGVSAGTVLISYTVSGIGSTTMTMYVLTAAQCAGITSPITGGNTVCAGSSVGLSNATSGGTWTSSNISVATVGSTTGVVYGVTGGTSNISYVAAGISAVMTMTVSSAGSIVGGSVVCTGANLELSDFTASSGGTWSSSNTTVATISYSGFDASVHGITSGTTIISYVTPTGCINTHTVTVSSSVTPGVISGLSTVYAGGDTTHLNETSPLGTGTWSSSNTTVATIDQYTGVYTGVAAGTSVITYTLTGCSGTSYATYTVTVTPINGISGHVYFSGPPYSDPVKVWLITYNPSTLDLEAVDSVSISGSGSTGIYYQFPGIATDSYRVKAAVVYTYSVSTTGNMPTYHTSSTYWYSANVINHTSGTADVNEDINMLTGTVTTGPGFIGGNVTTGANRGTSTTGIPAVGLNVYLFNSSGSTLLQLTSTDASGNYGFSNLPLGTYYVFPDSLNFATTAYTGITLTSGTPTMSAADFIQHTLSKTITPVTTGVKNINNVTPSILIYPNPTHNTLTITSTDNITNILITNIVGQTVYAHDYNTQQVQVSVATLPPGVYFVKVNGTDVRKFVKE